MRRRRRGYTGRVPRFGRGFLRTGGFYRRYNRGTNGVKPERKFHDVSIPNITVLGFGTELTPTADDTIIEITEGAGQSQRIGRKILINMIIIRLDFELANSTSATVTHEVIRIILLVDHQANGAAASFGTIYEATDHNGFRNLDNPRRFTILWDKVFMMHPTTQVGTSSIIMVKNVRYVKNVRIPVIYSAATGELSTIRQNNIQLWVVSKHGSRVSVQGRVRIRFFG